MITIIYLQSEEKVKRLYESLNTETEQQIILMLWMSFLGVAICLDMLLFWVTIQLTTVNAHWFVLWCAYWTLMFGIFYKK